MSYLARYSKLNQMAGLYMNLFLLAIRILSLRRKDPGIKILIAASCIMAVLGTSQMAVTIAMTTLDIRFIRQVVHSQVMKQFRPDAVEKLLTVQNGIFTINKWVNPIPELYRCYMVWGSQRKIIIVPAVFILSTFAVGIGLAMPFNSSIKLRRITYGLCAVTNVVLTVFTGKVLKGSPAGRIMWIRRAAYLVGLENTDNTIRSRYNTAIGVILESGAIYCLCAIFLLITISLDDPQSYAIGLGIGKQLINIIPTFTLVYVGLNKTDYSHPATPIHNVSSNGHMCTALRLGAVQSCQPGVLDIKPQWTTRNHGGYV
ncbi:hypothetical protein B0H13DRAFT_2512937 [Mycena leptocephala]|nr:hypothetical protein B0H13DRAFT_2512937 [Mycena leptocephala]